MVAPSEHPRYSQLMSPSSPASWPARLEDLGWFRFVDEARAADAKRAIVAQPYVLAGDVRRMFHADAEELAEGGIMDFLGSVLPVLRAEGVAVEAQFGQWKRPAGGPPVEPDEPPGPLLSLRISAERGGPLVEVTSQFNEERYVMLIGEREFPAWQASDDGVATWRGATVAALDLLNFLLDGHDSRERAWALMGGNDLHVVFATQDACRFINSTLAPRDQLHDGTRTERDSRGVARRRGAGLVERAAGRFGAVGSLIE